MDSLNVFMKNGSDMFGLVPYSFEYVDLVEVIMNELKFDGIEQNVL